MYSRYLKIFAETGAKHHSAFVVAAFADEESCCQLKLVTGFTSTSRMGTSKLSVAESVVFHSLFVPELVDMDKVSWRQVDGFSLEYEPA